MVNTQVLRLESVSIVRLLQVRKRSCLESFKHVLVVEYASLRICECSKHAIVALAQACSSQKFKECACGKCTGLPVLRCCRLALVVTPVSYLGLYAKHALGEATLNFLSRECF